MSTRTKDLFFNALLVGIAATVALIYASYRRPIWIDEFLHFAFGGLPDFSSALAVVYETTIGVNHGQTGTYFLINYFSLKAFGADFLALRWPSILSGFLLLIFAAIFMWAKGLARIWQLLIVLVLGSQVGLMYFAGEARSYMPLAAAVVGTLAYYSISLESRSRFAVAALGWISVLLGVTMHPYYFLYWPVIVAFCYLARKKDNERLSSLKRVMLFANPALVLTGVTVGLVVGALTWLRGQPEFSRDPFEGTRARGGYWRTVADAHLEFLPIGTSSLILMVLLVLGLVAISLFRLFSRGSKFAPLLAPLVLFSLSIALSGALSAISLANSYWILPRQWVASMALVPIALVWLAATVVLIIKNSRPKLGTAVTAITFGLFALVSINRLSLQLQAAGDDVSQFNLWIAQGDIQLPSQVATPATNEEWIIFANNNVIYGGSVWPEVARYYGYNTQAPSGPEAG